MDMRPEDMPPATAQEHDEYDDWVLRLRPLKNFGFPENPPCRRMARMLKAALRSFGFRSVSHYQVTDEKKAGEKEAG